MSPCVISVVPYIGTWIETIGANKRQKRAMSYLIQVRGLKLRPKDLITIYFCVVPYIGTWIETLTFIEANPAGGVVPYIGTWIETTHQGLHENGSESYLIQVRGLKPFTATQFLVTTSRTLYRYVD